MTFGPRDPANAPQWLPEFSRSVSGLFRRQMPQPLKLWRAATADFPTADDANEGALAYDLTLDRVAVSVNSAWVTLMPYTAGAALTRVDDTNVTLTLGGTPATALLAAASLTLGWTGQLSAARGGTGVSSLGNITKTDDTNVTLTLGGTPTGAVITSTSFTLGWTGTLAVARGGTGASTASGARTNLGLGTAAVKNTGTSGDAVPVLNGAATTWAGSLFSPSGQFSGAHSSVPTGSGVEIIGGASGTIAAFNRTGGAYIALALDASVLNFRPSGTTALSVAATAITASQPFILKSYTVAALPASADAALAYASDGRKTGEGAGAGTGVPVYRDGGTWYRFADDTAVAA